MIKKIMGGPLGCLILIVCGFVAVYFVSMAIWIWLLTFGVVK